MSGSRKGNATDDDPRDARPAGKDAVEDLPPRPVRPRPDECCGSGCVRCVFDVYEEALEKWEREVAARAAAKTAPS